MNKFLVLVLVLICVNVQAVEFTVNTTEDSIDANIADGLCLDSNGLCSLRAAIMQTNILGTDDVIYLPRGEAYQLTLTNDIDTQGSNDLDIWDSLTISIIEPNLPILSFDDMAWITVGFEGAIDDRVFEIHTGELISLTGIVVAYGDAKNSLSNPDQGGGIYVSEQVSEFRLTDSVVVFNRARYGAGLYSRAEETWIESSDISYNTLVAPGFPFVSVSGAGIYHNGMQLTLNKSSIHHNFIENVDSFASALYLVGEDSMVSILNTLIADNGVWASGASGVVDGIRAFQTDLRVNNSNITGNAGEGISFGSDAVHTLTLRNSVLAYNTLGDCGGLTGEQDFGGPLNPAHIISSDLSCSLPELANNRQNVNPNLSVTEGRFGAFGLQFFSFQFPMANSVLIDAGNSIDVNSGHVSACEATDIRGVNRPINGGLFNFCDVGIYESDDVIFRAGFDFMD